MPFLFLPIAIAGTALAGVLGYRAHDAADKLTGKVSDAQSGINTVQLLLALGLVYGGYRFVKEFK